MHGSHQEAKKLIIICFSLTSLLDNLSFSLNKLIISNSGKILLRKKPEGSVEFLFCIKKVNKTIDMIITINKDVKKNIFFIFLYSRRIYPNPLFNQNLQIDPEKF
tara:strand:+ start:171 stop:485 length:315 start_codon:yes stop_codon:yes gene_type:complete